MFFLHFSEKGIDCGGDALTFLEKAFQTSFLVAHVVVDLVLHVLYVSGARMVYLLVFVVICAHLLLIVDLLEIRCAGNVRSHSSCPEYPLLHLKGEINGPA